MRYLSAVIMWSSWSHSGHKPSQGGALLYRPPARARARARLPVLHILQSRFIVIATSLRITAISDVLLIIHYCDSCINRSKH